jgi:imidazolonepropionase-like amidohydrolase
VSIRAADDSGRSSPGIRDFSRFTVLPGLVDSHTHLDFDVLAGLETQQAAVDDAGLAMRMVTVALSTHRWVSRQFVSRAAAISSI